MDMKGLINNTKKASLVTFAAAALTGCYTDNALVPDFEKTDRRIGYLLGANPPAVYSLSEMDYIPLGKEVRNNRGVYLQVNLHRGNGIAIAKAFTIPFGCNGCRVNTPVSTDEIRAAGLRGEVTVTYWILDSNKKHVGGIGPDEIFIEK